MNEGRKAQLLMGLSLYRNSAQTATIAASPLRLGRSITGNVTATKTATEERLYTIGEVSRLADLKPFVLRYWESEIPMLQPTKVMRGAGSIARKTWTWSSASNGCSTMRATPSPARAATCAKKTGPTILPTADRTTPGTADRSCSAAECYSIFVTRCTLS